MPIMNGRPLRVASSMNALPRLVLLPGLHPDADPRPALLPAQPRAVPVLFATVGAAVAELHRLARMGAGGAA